MFPKKIAAFFFLVLLLFLPWERARAVSTLDSNVYLPRDDSAEQETIQEMVCNSVFPLKGRIVNGRCVIETPSAKVTLPESKVISPVACRAMGCNWTGSFCSCDTCEVINGSAATQCRMTNFAAYFVTPRYSVIRNNFRGYPRNIVPYRQYVLQYDTGGHGYEYIKVIYTVDSNCKPIRIQKVSLKEINKFQIISLNRPAKKCYIFVRSATSRGRSCFFLTFTATLPPGVTRTIRAREDNEYYARIRFDDHCRIAELRLPPFLHCLMRWRDVKIFSWPVELKDAPIFRCRSNGRTFSSLQECRSSCR